MQRVLQVMVMVVFYNLLIHYGVVIFVDVVTSQVLICLVVGCLILVVYEDVLLDVANLCVVVDCLILVVYEDVFLDVANLCVVVDGVVFIMHVVLGCMMRLLGYVDKGGIIVYVTFINVDKLFLVEGIS